MKVRVSIAGISEIALLDSGSSHNFIDTTWRSVRAFAFSLART